MKNFRIILLTAALLLCSVINTLAQKEGPLKVTQFQLENGLTVILNEDHSRPEVFGAVVVKAGSKNDPADATGIAHYFEHIMFKGTDKIGTLNYTEEKVFLDSISFMYDSLARTTDEITRTSIQLKINNLSLKASDYAIPNEVDVVLRDIGSTGLNAYTSFEQTVFHNSFPANQIEKWMDIYSERFRNPVFRLFQSELETVYEEKNMYLDNQMMTVFEDLLKTFYKHHPYGQQTTIGSAEHLKNPRLSKMMDFYHTYYVANNMALVLCGDFDSEKIIPMIREKFGEWTAGEIPKYTVYTEDTFMGRELKEVKLTPVRIGILGYRTVPNNHPDEVALNLCNSILSNEASTGLFDKLVMDNQLMAASAFSFPGNDLGGTFMLFVPKIIGQKFEDADAMVRAQLDSLRKGAFSDELLEALKLEYRKNREKMLETSQNRAGLLVNAFVSGTTWDEVLNEIRKVEKITREDIIRVANQYYADNYLAYWSNMGFPKKDKINKPDWKPVLPKNTEAKSDFAQQLDKIQELPMQPEFIDFEADLQTGEIRNGYMLYYNTNPYNDVFSLTINYKTGKLNEPKLEQAVMFMNLIGTESKTYQEFRAELQKLGASCDFGVDDNYLTLNIDGFDKNLVPTLRLVNELLTTAKSDETQLDKFIQEAKANYKMMKDDPQTLGDALFAYALYRDQSSYLRQLSLKEIKALKGDELISIFKQATGYNADILYTGKTPYDEVHRAIKENLPLKDNPVEGKYIELQPLPNAANTVYINQYSKAVQSNIYLYTSGDKLTEQDKAIAAGFNEYFGSGMSSLVFQEIREFRSLSYAAYAIFRSPYYPENHGYLRGFMGTQADKTIEGIQVMSGLFIKMPEKPERMEGIQKALLQSIFTEQPDFRDVPSVVARWKNQGYTSDPREYRYSIYKTMTFDDITKFYTQQVSNRPLVITISGNLKDVSKDDLKKFGTLIDVKQKQIIKE